MTRWAVGTLIETATPAERERWAEEANRWNRSKAMKVKKLKWGLVEIPATNDHDDRQLDQWHEQIDSALAVAKVAEERENTLNAVAPDASRFPVLGDRR